MTEDQIERRAEREMDKLDSRYMSGKITQTEYDREVRAIEARARAAYKNIR